MFVPLFELGSDLPLGVVNECCLFAIYMYMFIIMYMYLLHVAMWLIRLLCYYKKARAL